MKKSITIVETEQALQTVQKLWQKGKLHEALQQIDLIEQKFPSSSKAAKVLSKRDRHAIAYNNKRIARKA